MNNTKENYWKTVATILVTMNIIMLVFVFIVLNEVRDLTETIYSLENPVVSNIKTSQDVFAEEKKKPITEKTKNISFMDKPLTQDTVFPWRNVDKIEEKTESIYPVDKPLTEHEIIEGYADQIAAMYYNVDSATIKSIIQHESEFNPNHITGDCVGLMQVSKRWHLDRAKKLGVTDLLDPYSNILVGTDYISELIEQYKDPALALMLYNMRHDKAFKLYAEGRISWYAEDVLALADEYRKGE